MARPQLIFISPHPCKGLSPKSPPRACLGSHHPCSARPPHPKSTDPRPEPRHGSAPVSLEGTRVIFSTKSSVLIFITCTALLGRVGNILLGEWRIFFQLVCRERERSQRQCLFSEGMPQGLTAAPEMVRARRVLRRLLRPPYLGPLLAAPQSGAGERDGSWPCRAFSKALIAANSQPLELQIK